jgi:hypothetical protein
MSLYGNWTCTWRTLLTATVSSQIEYYNISLTTNILLDFINSVNYPTNNNNSPTNNNKKEEDRKHKVYAHNPYNGVVYNDIILATGVFSSKELWKMSKGESEELNPPELTVRNTNCFPASILQDTSENTMGSNASSSSNGSINNTGNIKIENTNSYYCNSYANTLQTATPTITAITGGYSKSLDASY